MQNNLTTPVDIDAVNAIQPWSSILVTQLLLICPVKSPAFLVLASPAQRVAVSESTLR